MRIDAIPHFENIVLPAIRAYFDAEVDLTRTFEGAAADAQAAAGYAALRQGGAAVFYLHHFVDIIAHRPAPMLPDFHGSARAARDWLAQFSGEHLGHSDVGLLTDICDALKHSVLTHNLPREVEEADQVLAVARGYGVGRFGEGKYGGGEEVWVLARSEPRPLGAILTSVSKAWSLALSV